MICWYLPPIRLARLLKKSRLCWSIKMVTFAFLSDLAISSGDGKRGSWMIRTGPMGISSSQLGSRFRFIEFSPFPPEPSSEDPDEVAAVCISNGNDSVPYPANAKEPILHFAVTQV